MSKKDAGTFQGMVCNLCGETRKGVRDRLQYPSKACGRCYRRWKRGFDVKPRSAA